MEINNAKQKLSNIVFDDSIIYFPLTGTVLCKNGKELKIEYENEEIQINLKLK